MIVELISIGTELLLGDILDTNARYISEKLTENGFDLLYQTIVGDNQQRLESTLETALSRSRVVITTGGLGPTADDITREAVAGVTGLSLVKKEKLVAEIEDFFHTLQKTPTRNNYRQAYLPEGAEPLENPLGTAPGIYLKHEGKIIICLPGVPTEMKEMFTRSVLPRLQGLSDHTIKSRVLHFTGIGESSLETELKDILQEQSNPTIALLAGRGEVKVRITAKAETPDHLEQLISGVEARIYERVGEYIYGTDDQSLAGVIGNKLREKGLTLSLAESCTGGLLGNRITDIPGSSDYFMGGMVVYSNQAKQRLLGVSRSTLEKYGAVSRQTAREMAVQIREKFSTDIGVSLTGIAGPGGGTETKPVGLVYLGLTAPGKVEVYEYHLKKDRALNKWFSSQFALHHLFQLSKEI